MSNPGNQDRIEYPQVGLRGKIPSLLADLQSQKNDIAFAADCSRTYARILRTGDEFYAMSGPIPRALWNAAAMAYRRAFSSGRSHAADRGTRFRLQDQLNHLLNEAQLKVHKDSLEMANQHVAHQVGQLEQIAVNVCLYPPEVGRDVLFIADSGIHFNGPTTEFSDLFIELCDLILSYVESGIEDIQDKLISDLRRPESLDDLYRQVERQRSSIQP